MTLSNEPDIIFIKDNAAMYLRKFSNKVRTSQKEKGWRCLYTMFNPEITKDLLKRNIVSAFLKTAFSDMFDVKAFWLTSGHLFIFFQGPVRGVIKNYEEFLANFSVEGEKGCHEYHFFWELDEFFGYFDEILAHLIEDSPSQSCSGSQRKEEIIKDVAVISKDLYRQRIMRYKPLLLIVEDDRITRHFLQAIMEKYCDIAVAWNASQARKIYHEMLPDITFLDIDLPDGDGCELAELFSCYDKNSFIVMVSGTLSSENIERCLRAGVKGAVKKPAKEGELLKFIDQYNQIKQSRVAALG